MEKRTIRLIISMVLCLIPAGIAFGAYPDLEIGKKLAYAVCFYLAFLLPFSSIVRLADSDYRSNASTKDKIDRWMEIIVFPICFFVFLSCFRKGLGTGPVGTVWVSLAASLTVTGIVGGIIKFIVRAIEDAD